MIPTSSSTPAIAPIPDASKSRSISLRTSRDGILLWQVACEFVAASRKLSAQGFTASDAGSRLAEFLAVLRLVLPTAGELQRAQTLHTTHGVSFWDALILAACAEAGVRILYSEDVPALPKVGALQVVNPFT